jgi:hypothetical protein
MVMFFVILAWDEAILFKKITSRRKNLTSICLSYSRRTYLV